jgi:hypothetical protein
MKNLESGNTAAAPVNFTKTIAFGKIKLPFDDKI